MPKDLESYYQEAGRAGRDGDPARCVLLYSGTDVRTAQYFIDKERDDPESEVPADVRAEAARKAEERLKWMTFYAATQDCLRGFILKYFGERPTAPCGHCGACAAREREQRRAASPAFSRPAAGQGESVGRPQPSRRFGHSETWSPQTERDEALLAALFALRKRLAAKKKLPAYLIFSDASLREICEKKPVSREEFLTVRGVGEVKADRYGKAVTDLVRQFLEAEN